MSRIGGKCPLTFSCLPCHLINVLLSGSGSGSGGSTAAELQHSQSSLCIQLFKKSSCSSPFIRFHCHCFNLHLSNFFLLPIFAQRCPESPCRCQLRVSPRPTAAQSSLWPYLLLGSEGFCRARWWHSGSPEKGLE